MRICSVVEVVNHTVTDKLDRREARLSKTYPQISEAIGLSKPKTKAKSFGCCCRSCVLHLLFKTVRPRLRSAFHIRWVEIVFQVLYALIVEQ